MGGWGGDDHAPPDPRRLRAAENLVRLDEQIERDVAAGTVADAALVRRYHSIAMEGMLEPGQLRTRDVVIGSRFGSIVFHEPPPAREVAVLLDAACAEIQQRFTIDFVVAAAYALWRLNWIHPFSDGNGRTSRAVAYLLVGLGLGELPPGAPAIPEAICQRRFDYQDALVAADRSARSGIIDVSAMELLLDELLSRQLTGSS